MKRNRLALTMLNQPVRSGDVLKIPGSEDTHVVKTVYDDGSVEFYDNRGYSFDPGIGIHVIDETDVRDARRMWGLPHSRERKESQPTKD